MNNTDIKEAIRQINMGLSEQNSDSQMLAFITVDDKTIVQQTIIANLAMMYSQVGESVLIIDTDFKQKNFSEVFRVKAKYNLSDYLMNTNVSKEKIINVVSGQNISLISSGNTNENFQYLLGDPKFHDLIKATQIRYDRVLVNTALFTGHENISPIVGPANGIILVTSSKRTKKRNVRKLIELLRLKNKKIVGYISSQR